MTEDVSVSPPIEELHPVDKICNMHYTFGGTDGVTLQVGETESYLINHGIRVISCASDVPEGIPELDYHSQPVRELTEAILDPGQKAKVDDLMNEITDQAGVIQKKMLAFLEENGVQIAHVRNVTSLPLLHLPAAVALYNVIRQRPDIGFLLHHHDFPWEGPRATKFVTGYEEIASLADQVMTPDFPNTSHVVLNSLAAKELFSRRGIRAEVIPDGFNFNKPLPHIDEETFSADFGFRENDLLVGMMTRIRPNKGMPLALQFVHALEKHRKTLEANPNGVGLRRKQFGPDSRIYLVLPQSMDLDYEYFEKIKEMAGKINVKLCYIGDSIVQDRQYSSQEHTYPFYGVYQPMDLIVYPSIYEGFGNQAIEAAWARKLLVMHAYPVAEADILPHVGGIITMGNNNDLLNPVSTISLLRDEVVQEAAQETISALLDHDLDQRMTNQSFTDFRRLCDIDMIAARYRTIYQQLRERTMHR